MQLYEYAVIYHPDEKQKKDGKKDQLVIPPTCVLAESENAAAMRAARAIPQEYETDLAQIEVLIRPFAVAVSK